MARRVPILAKLLGAYLGPAVATFLGFGLLAHEVARHALEEELGRRLSALAGAAAAQVADENVSLLQPGDEETRTYRNLQRRLRRLATESGAARIFVFAPDRTSRCDTRAGIPIGARYYALDAWQSELRRVFKGQRATSVLFAGRDGALYKSGFAPLRAEAGHIGFAVGVDGAAVLYTQLASFRRTLVGVGMAGALLIVLLSVVVARRLVRPIHLLAHAAERIGRGELDQPVRQTSRDEIGLVAETMDEMRQQLRRRDERMQMMLAGIAHEVRNPLGGLELFAGLLRDELAEGAPELAHVARIERELGHLKTIVNDFLEYARRPAPTLVDCELSTLLAEVQELVRAEAAQRRVQLEVEAAPVRARADAAQLRRALLNLLRNAVQACPDDGTGRVRLRCHRAKDGVALAVSDNGGGIDPAHAEHIWTPFFTTKQSGTGLGLAFVRDIVRDHGTRVEVAGGSGRGTTFSFTLQEAT